MMTLQSWRPMFSDAMKKQFMQSRFWESYRNEWTWELAVVDEGVIKSIYGQMSQCEQQVLHKLLDGLLLQPKQESVLIGALSQQLGRPKQQCIAALEAFSAAGIVSMLRHQWQGCYWLMALPIFHSWRTALHDVFNEHNSCSGHDDLAEQEYCLSLPAQLEQLCRFAQPVPLSVRLVLFLHQLSLQPLSFTRQGELRKTLLKLLQRQQEQLAACPALERLWEHSFSSSVGGVESFMLELAYDLGLLDRDNNGLSLNTPMLNKWLKLSRQVQDKLISQWLLQHMLQQHHSFITLFVNDLLSSGGSFWLHTSLYEMSDKLMKQEGISQEQVLQQWQMLQQLLQFLGECGLVSYAVTSVAAESLSQAVDRVAEQNPAPAFEYKQAGSNYTAADAGLGSMNQDARLYARFEPAPPCYDILHLEQNGELLALPGTRSELIWQALEIAELISPQEVLLFRITPQSLQSAVMRGHKASAIKGWLHSLCAAELPQLVQQMMESTLDASSGRAESTDHSLSKPPLLPLATETGQLGCDGISIKTATAAYDEHVENDEQQADYGLLRNYDAIYYELRKLSAWGIYCANPLGMLLEADLLAPHQIHEHLHSTGTEMLTRSWQRELRRYHSSTMLQIVEAALQFGFALYITMSGKLWHLVPQYLEEQNGKWYVTAAVYARPSLEPLTIELSSIEAIQLDIDEGKGA